MLRNFTWHFPLTASYFSFGFRRDFTWHYPLLAGSKGKYAGEYAQLEGSENSNVEQKVDLDNSNGKTTRPNPSKSKSRCNNETSDSSTIEKCDLLKNLTHTNRPEN